MTEPCIAQAIWDRVAPKHDRSTAQGRAALDNELRKEIARIEDKVVRAHAAEIIRGLRWDAYHKNRAIPRDDEWIWTRIRRIEKHLGLPHAIEIESFRRRS
jgi:hypothetical protein